MAFQKRLYFSIKVSIVMIVLKSSFKYKSKFSTSSKTARWFKMD